VEIKANNATRATGFFMSQVGFRKRFQEKRGSRSCRAVGVCPGG
jgi:hypothetical protein